MGTTEYLFLALFFGVPGVAAAWLARTRGKNPLLWGVAAAVFPFVLLVIWYHKPDRTVPGHFRKCQTCGSVYAWKLTACKYCGTPRV